MLRKLSENWQRMASPGKSDVKSLAATLLAVVLPLILTVCVSTAHAEIDSDPNGSFTNYRGTIELSGHTQFDWALAPNFGGIKGNLILWVNGSPISGSYNDYGPYRFVRLDQYGASFVYVVDRDEFGTPSAVILYFIDDFGNWISPTRNVLREDL